MTNRATFLLFILLPTTGMQAPFNIIIYIYKIVILTFTLPVLAQQIATFNEDDMVQCFNDVTSCNVNSNVMMITAGQCCNTTGGSSRHVRVVSGNQTFCSSCFGEFIIIININYVKRINLLK